MERLETILRDLGLDDAMIEVFSYLAKKRRASLEELFEGTALSRCAISRALNALESKGTVKRDGEDFTIGDPQAAMMALLPSRFEEIKAEIFSYSPPVAERSCPIVKTIRDEAGFTPSFASCNFNAATASVDIISSSMAWLDDNSLDAARAAVQRAVKVRVLTHRQPELEAEARALTDAGVEVRSHEYSRGVRFLIVDGEYIAFAFGEPPGITKPSYFGLTIRDRDVCKKALEYIFDPAWEGAEAVEKYRA